MIRWILVLVMAMNFWWVAPVGAASSNSNNNAQNFYFEDFTADYYLTREADGTANLHVKEVLKAEFPETNQNHGITRQIPNTNQGGANKVVANQAALNLVVTRNGNPEPVEISAEDGYYLARIGDTESFVNGEQVYVLEYDFTNVITEFDAAGENVSGQDGESVTWQELYWDTNGTGWQQRFNKVVANLHINLGADDDVWQKIMRGQTSCYVGAYRESGSGRCEITEVADGYKFEAENLAVGENLTFAVDFEPGTFEVILEKNYALVIMMVIEVVILGSLLGWTVWRWRKTAAAQQKLYKNTFVKAEYLPPKDVTVAEGGAASANKIKNTYVATLLELVVTKKVSIRKAEKSKWGVTLLVEPQTLTGPQQEMLKILAASDNLVAHKEIIVRKHYATRTLAGYAANYLNESREMLVKKGYLVAKKGVSARFTVAIVVIFMAFWAVFIVGQLAFGVQIEAALPSDNAILVGGTVLAVTLVVILIVGIVAICVVNNKTRNFSRYTDAGVKLARYLDGLELYIDMAEAERLKFLQSVKGVDMSAQGMVKLYEKMLPWACLFGQEKSWAAELDKYYDAADVTRTMDRDVMNGIIVANLMRDVNRSVSSAINYTNSSSSASGGGGGGFSGGGGGGGGGGGW